MISFPLPLIPEVSERSELSSYAGAGSLKSSGGAQCRLAAVWIADHTDAWNFLLGKRKHAHHESDGAL